MKYVVQVEGNMLPEMVLNLLKLKWWVRKSSRGTDVQGQNAYRGTRWFLRLRLHSHCFQSHGLSQAQGAVLHRHQYILHRPSLDLHLHRLSQADACVPPSSLMTAITMSLASRPGWLKCMFKGMILPSVLHLGNGEQCSCLSSSLLTNYSLHGSFFASVPVPFGKRAKGISFEPHLFAGTVYPPCWHLA